MQIVTIKNILILKIMLYVDGYLKESNSYCGGLHP
jgi:hypothetical protein